MACNSQGSSRTAIAAWLVPLSGLIIFSGCSEIYRDRPQELVQTLPIPAGWARTDVYLPVPGAPIAAWSDTSQGNGLIAFQTLPDPRPQGATALAGEWGFRHENQPGTHVIKSGTVNAAETPLARIELTQELGAGKEPLSNNSRRRVYLGMPAKNATYWLMFHCPEAQAEALEPIIEDFLKKWNPPHES